MENHAPRNSEGRNKRRTGLNGASRLKKASIIALCMIFFLCAIYITDMSTRRMMLCKDDKYAIGAYRTGADVLRVDLAGEHYMLNYKEVRETAGNLIKESEKLIKDVAGKVKNRNND